MKSIAAVLSAISYFYLFCRKKGWNLFGIERYTKKNANKKSFKTRWTYFIQSSQSQDYFQ